MNISSATIQSSKPLQAAKPALAQPVASPTDAAPAESFQRSSEALPTLYARDSASRNIGSTVARSVAGAVAGGALVTWAVSNGGVAGGIAGAAALVLPAATGGFLGAGLAADQFGKRKDASDIIGMALWGGLGGGALGLTAGALLGSSGSSAATLGLGLVGALSGAYVANFGNG